MLEEIRPASKLGAEKIILPPKPVGQTVRQTDRKTDIETVRHTDRHSD